MTRMYSSGNWPLDSDVPLGDSQHLQDSSGNNSTHSSSRAHGDCYASTLMGGGTKPHTWQVRAWASPSLCCEACTIAALEPGQLAARTSHTTVNSLPSS
jgi:hypothetical protein